MQYLIADERAALIPYSHERDAEDWLRCWQDEGTQRGYNYIMPDDLRCIVSQEVSSFPFWATAIELATGARLGVLRLSPDADSPDLAIWVYPGFRGRGWGTRIYRLALCCLARQGVDTVYAGCFSYNQPSLRMLASLDFERYPEGDTEEISVFDGSNVRMLGFIRRQNG